MDVFEKGYSEIPVKVLKPKGNRRKADDVMNCGNHFSLFYLLCFFNAERK